MQTEKPTYLRRRKPGDLGQLKRVLWGSLIEIEELVLWSEDPDRKIKAAHCLAQLSASYMKVLEIADVQTQIKELRDVVETGNIHALRRPA